MKKTNPMATDQPIEELTKLGLDGTLYVGYPVLVTADETICIDASLLSETHGLIVFHFPKNDPLDIQFWSVAFAFPFLGDRLNWLLYEVFSLNFISYPNN